MECSVDVTTFFVLLTLFSVLTDERLISKGGCPHQDVGCETIIGREEEWNLTDKGILSCNQDDPNVAVLDPAIGTLDRRRVCSEETMGVSDRPPTRFTRLLGGGWGQEDVGDGVNQLYVLHLGFSI